MRISPRGKVTVGGEHRLVILSLRLKLACDYSMSRALVGFFDGSHWHEK